MMRRASQGEEAKGRRALLQPKTLGCLAGIAVVLIMLFLAGRALWQLHLEARAASCPNDVFYLSMALFRYAKDHDGLLPPISDQRGNVMVESEGFYPEYLDNSCWVQCEWSPTRQRRKIEGGSKNDDLGVSAFNDDSFCYIPWRLQYEEEGLAFIEAYKTLDLSKRDQDLVVQIGGDTRVLPRIKIDPEALQAGATSAAPAYPILVEWPDHAHIKGVVAYSDGSRRLMSSSDGFPMTEKFIAGLREIAALDKSVPVWEIE